MINPAILIIANAIARALIISIASLSDPPNITKAVVTAAIAMPIAPNFKTSKGRFLAPKTSEIVAKAAKTFNREPTIINSGPITAKAAPI